jgi:hypothetical protein
MSFKTSFREKVRNKNSTFIPYIFIETDFNFSKNTYPILALMFTNRARYIKDLNLKDGSIDEISNIVKKHYFDNSGVFPIWGKIQKYKYYYQPEKALLFDNQGSLINLKQRN